MNISFDWTTKIEVKNMTTKRYCFLNEVIALKDFKNLLASKMTSFFYGDSLWNVQRNLLKLYKKR